MKFVELQDLLDLSLGATILGSGGGGSPDYDILIAEKHFMDYGKATLLDISELKEDDFVVPIAFAGAPLVSTEQLPSGYECELLLEAITELFGKKPTHIMPAEIGGANALCPFLFASRLNIPVLDADTIGRAFPELQMSSCNLFGVPPSPAFIADAVGNSVIVKATNATNLEMIARKAIVAMGSSALIAIYLMNGELAQKSVVSGTVSQAISLGKTIRQAKAKGQDPIEILKMNHQVHLIGSGVIDDISQSIEEGFLNGTVSIITNNEKINIDYQNEYLRVELDGITASLTPEIIIVMDSESFLPITSEKLQYGMRVSVLAMPAPSIWTTEEGLKLVGPEYFGF